MGFLSKLFGGSKSNEEIFLRTIAYCNVDASFPIQLTSAKFYKNINSVFLDDKLSDEIIKDLSDESTTILMDKTEEEVFSDLMNLFAQLCETDSNYEELLLVYLYIMALESRTWNEGSLQDHYTYLAGKLEPFMIDCGWTKETYLNCLNDTKSDFEKGNSILFLSSVIGEIMDNEDLEI
jgi:hypothetical protein